LATLPSSSTRVTTNFELRQVPLLDPRPLGQGPSTISSWILFSFLF
jgi:hypothetical protein